ncbi:hypothetical protein [Altererythrobacter sp. MF3-039]|uniref:hypothetical protein n=1 Tax=Altererythrobacter sp. MF3-039 TaxID=3252901 RepID=UPI00390CA8C4
MRKISIALATGLAFSLAACGSADDASTEAEPDTVEVGAEEAIADVDAEPVEDPEAAALEAATAAAEEEAERATAAESAGDAAADVAAQVDAAMAESGDE